MTTSAPQERPTWLPLGLAGGFVAFALAVALIAYVANRDGVPSQAATVDDVSLLAVEAVDEGDREFAQELA